MKKYNYTDNTKLVFDILGNFKDESIAGIDATSNKTCTVKMSEDDFNKFKEEVTFQTGSDNSEDNIYRGPHGILIQIEQV